MPGKKQNKQNRIDTNGQNILLATLPNSEEFSMKLSWESNDFGIDGQIQIFNHDEQHTGEFLKFQLKSTASPQYIKKDSILRLDLDIDSAYFLTTQVKDPTILFVVDTIKKITYWHPLQLDNNLITQINSKISRTKNTKRESVTVRINTRNVINHDKYEEVYKYYLDAAEKLAKERIIRMRTDPTLSRGLQVASEISENLLSLPGFDYFVRKEGSPALGTMFTAAHNANQFIDYVPNKEFGKSTIPTIRFQTKFNTKNQEDKSKYNEFKKIVEGGSGEIELDQSNIDSFEFKLGNKTLDSYSGKGNMSLRFAPIVNKIRNLITLRKDGSEIDVYVDTWVKEGNIYMESLATENIDFTLELDPRINKGKINLKLRITNLKSPKEELIITEQLSKFSGEFEILFKDNLGIRRKLIDANIDNRVLMPLARKDFLQALIDIEHTTGIPITYPIPDKLTDRHIKEVFWLHRLLKEGMVNKIFTANFALVKSTPMEIKKGMVIQFNSMPPEVYLFDKKYILSDFEQNIIGTIQSIKNVGHNKYKLKIVKATAKLIRILKKIK